MLRLRLKALFLRAGKELRKQENRRTLLPGFVLRWARTFYDSVLSDTQLERERTFSLRPIWEPDPSETFFLLDLPVSQPHITALLTLVASKDVRTVVYVHDLFPLSHKSLFDQEHHHSVRARHMRYLDVVVAADSVVCNSAFTRSQYSRFTALTEEESRQTLKTVYPPWPHFAERTDGSSSVVDEVFLDSEVRILAVGALDKRKNFIVLLKSLELLVARDIDARLVLVSGANTQTDPMFRAHFLSLPVNIRDRILVLSQVSDDRLIQIYDDSTVVAVPSLAEGFGLPIVEALRWGRPVVASRTTALTELAEVLPVILAETDDAHNWADELYAASVAGLSSPVPVPPEFPQDWHDFRDRVFA